MTKKLIIGLSVIGIIILAVVLVLLFYKPNYSIEGKVTDKTSKKPVADVTISEDGKETKTDKDGNYKMEKLKKETKISIKQPSQFEPSEEINITFNSRIKSETIKKDIELVPDLIEMETRVNEGSKQGQYDLNWEYMHPDDQAYWGNKEDYKNLFKKSDELVGVPYSIKSYKISENVKVLPKWKHEITGKEYDNVSGVPVETTFMNGQVDKYNSYWVKVDGTWRYFTQVNKTKLQKEISDYEKGVSS